MRFLPLLAPLAWCASGVAQVPPTAAEYAQYTGIFAAAAKNDSTKIAKLLNAGEYAGMRDNPGRTALHVATYRKHHDAMRVLAAATGDPNVLDDDRYDIVTIAAVANDVGTLRVALAIGYSPRSVTGPDDSTALIAAAQLGNEAAVRTLIGAGAPLDRVNKLGYTALIGSIVVGSGDRKHVATLKTLIAGGANVNLADRTGTTPLALARARDYREMIALLEGAGAK
jgi:ankyrin repeat protein